MSNSIFGLNVRNLREIIKLSMGLLVLSSTKQKKISLIQNNVEDNGQNEIGVWKRS